jgi:hypothetical protein
VLNVVTLETSQTTVVMAGISCAKVSSAFESMSQTAPWTAKARAISRPMPDAPAVTKTLWFIRATDLLFTLLGSPRLNDPTINQFLSYRPALTLEQNRQARIAKTHSHHCQISQMHF